MEFINRNEGLVTEDNLMTKEEAEAWENYLKTERQENSYQKEEESETKE